jgi:hypothetical protein
MSFNKLIYNKNDKSFEIAMYYNSNFNDSRFLASNIPLARFEIEFILFRLNL